MGRLNAEKIKEILNTFDQDSNGFLTMIETGTHLGETSINVSKDFKKIYTMEISERYFQLSIMNFQKYGIKNVEIFLGDSSKILPAEMTGTRCYCNMNHQMKKILVQGDSPESPGSSGRTSQTLQRYPENQTCST